MPALPGLRKAVRALLEASGPTRGELGRANAFVDPFARTFDVGRAEEAQRLENMGASPTDIFQDRRSQFTYRDPQNGWMQERPDTLAWRPEYDPNRVGRDEAVHKLVQRGILGRPVLRLGEALEGGAIEDYPFLAGTRLAPEGEIGASFEPPRPWKHVEDGRVTIGTPHFLEDQNTPYGALPTLAHEMTHGGQFYSGRINGPMGGIAAAFKAPYAQEVFERRMRGYEDDLAREDSILSAMGEENPRADAVRKLRELGPHPSIEGLASYLNNKGEREAFNVQARFHMTPEERLATPPWETEGDYRWTRADTWPALRKARWTKDLRGETPWGEPMPWRGVGMTLRGAAGLGGVGLTGSLALRAALSNQLAEEGAY